jgi:MoxR-like ATPase
MSQTVRPLAPTLDATSARELMERVARNLGRVLLGKDAEIERAVTCLVGRGHLLLEDVPGVGKTSLAESLARSFGLSFARIQFTSDLMPTDILGGQVYRTQTSTFEFRPGPLFHQLVLADELNRAPPRTQSALLEAMAQGQVSLDGVTHPLPQPFLVVATQNPVDLAGTYPLPDSQLDRFLMRLSLGHPAPEVEAKLLVTRSASDPVRSLEAAASPESLAGVQTYAAQLRVDPSVAEYAVRLATATREHADVERGASTRAVLALVAAAKAQALWDARDFITPGDVRQVFAPCLAHRLLLRSAVHGAFAREEAAHLLDDIARSVPEPR